MGYARETIVGYVSSLTGTTTFDALTANSNQSFTVRSFADGSTCYLEDVWQASAAHPMLLSIKSPRMHDDVLGIELASTPLGVGSAGADFNPQNTTPGSTPTSSRGRRFSRSSRTSSASSCSRRRPARSAFSAQGSRSTAPARG